MKLTTEENNEIIYETLESDIKITELFKVSTLIRWIKWVVS